MAYATGGLALKACPSAREQHRQGNQVLVATAQTEGHVESVS